MTMARSSNPTARLPEHMTFASARYFAADWESSSFIEFFVDLQLRVSDDAQAAVGRTLERLRDHSRFALQLVLLRSVDSYLSYLGEVMAAVGSKHSSGPLERFLSTKVHGAPRIPVDAGDQFLPALTHGNVRKLGRLFVDATDVDLFDDADDIAILARLISIRNLVAHGRTFASDELPALVEETASVGGLGLRWQDIRDDLDRLSSSVARIDIEVADKWTLDRPVSRDIFFRAIAAASKADVSIDEVGDDPISKWLR